MALDRGNSWLRQIYEVLSGGITANVSAGDIEIGAVEIKDAGADNRLKLTNADVLRASTEYGIVSRVVGLLEALGEIQASPTANTLLARLKTLGDATFTDDAAFTPGTGKGFTIGAQADETAADSVDEGDSGALRMTLARGLHANLRDSSGNELALGGATSVYRVLSAAASTNGANIKASAGRYWWIRGRNNAAASRFIKIYNKASGPTVGTDVPVDTIEVVASQPFILDFPVGVYLATGISIAITTAAADADTGALTAADITCLSVGYT